MIPIASRANEKFKALRKLCRSARERDRQGLAVLDGVHLVQAFRERFGEPLRIVVSERGRQQGEIAGLLAELRSEVVCVADALFDELATVETASGILALIRMSAPAGAPAPDVDCVLLDGIQDPGNLGSILRSAAAAGVRQILTSADCAQAWSPKTLRAGMGAHFQLAIHEAVDLPDFLRAYRGQSVLTTLDTENSLYTADLPAPLAWVFGNEGQGVRPEVAALCAQRVLIPMAGGTESLNVAAAAAVCLFETVRRRAAGG